MNEIPKLEKPTCEPTLEEYAGAMFWKHFRKDYIKDKKEIRRLEKPKECPCNSCARRDEERYLTLLRRWCTTPPDESKRRYPITKQKEG